MKKNKIVKKNNSFSSLIKQIRTLVEVARKNIASNINSELLLTYWNVGRLIVDKEKSEQYDETSVRTMMIELSKEFTREVGKVFSRTNLIYMRSFFLLIKMSRQCLDKCQLVRHCLTN